MMQVNHLGNGSNRLAVCGGLVRSEDRAHGVFTRISQIRKDGHRHEHSRDTTNVPKILGQGVMNGCMATFPTVGK